MPGIADLVPPESREAFMAGVAEANRGVTHEAFVAGMQAQSLGFQCVLGEPCELVNGIRKTIFNLLVLMYIAAPFVLIPLWAYHERNWWLLIGIVISEAASVWAHSRSVRTSNLALGSDSLSAFILLLCGISWYVHGIHNYWTFFPLCWVWGYLFCTMAESAQREYALQSLIENPELFRVAIARNMILITPGKLKGRDSLAEFQEAVRLNPDDAAAHRFLGAAYTEIGRWQEATAEFQEAVRLNPDDSVDVHHGLGRAYALLGRPLDALEGLQGAVRLNPDDAQAHAALGAVYATLNSCPRNAVAEFQAAVRLNPNDGNTHFGLGLSYLASGDHGAALDEYQVLKGLDANLADRLFKLLYPDETKCQA